MGVVSGIPSPCPITDDHPPHLWASDEIATYVYHCLGTTNHDGWGYHNINDTSIKE